MGIELQPDLQQIAAANVARNALAGRVEILPGDLLQPPFPSESFDHVMTNPPYLTAPAATPPPHPERARAHVEATALDAGLGSCLRMLAAGGSLTLIHSADRLDEILAGLAGSLGALAVFPLWPGERGKPARRVLVQGRKGSRAPLALLPGLVLHGPDGRFSAAAEAVLRHGEALRLQDGPAHA
jgi:tRNA1(Val) A37 N6-methylase TrmN6